MRSRDEREPELLPTLARSAPTSTLRSPTFRLSVVEGADRGRAVVVDGSRSAPLLVGQAPSSDLVLRDRLVSRRHAALELRGKLLSLHDLGSTNGTMVNGVLVEHVLLRGGETLRIGDTILRVELGDREAEVVLTSATEFGRVKGASVEMRRLYPLFERIAASDISVLIEGETGTGKEVLAESLHESSPRAAGPFVVFDCTAVPSALLESALFGHERGAFTGAVSARRGAFEQAQGGTILIDEIGELDMSLQPKLLRAIERGEVQRVGSEHWLRVDVRVVTATRRDLDQEIQKGRFRDDLYFRLAVAKVVLPPLRHRGGDIGFLARHFWSQIGGAGKPLPYDALARFEDYAWPGNVRELYNAVARQLALGELTEEASSGIAARAPDRGGKDPIADVLALGLPLPRARDKIVEEFERRYVERVLEEHAGNVSKAAAASGIALRYFQQIRAKRVV